MNTPIPRLRQIHLQLTCRCNLHCSFCGQWGKHGFMAGGERNSELNFDEWKRVIDSIARESEKSSIRPQFTLWGGEPTLSPDFLRILQLLDSYGFDVGIVTNGTLLEKNAEIVNRYVKVLYFSIDGLPGTHDAVRGVPGTFDRLIGGLRSLEASTVKLVGMSVVCEKNIRELGDLPYFLHREIPNLSMLIVSQLMFLTPAEAAEQTRYAAEKLQSASRHVNSWVNESVGDYVRELPELLRRFATEKYPFPVKVSPVGIAPENVVAFYRSSPERAQYCCEMPYSHINVKADGDVILCVDFDDYVLGNARRDDVVDLFYGERARRFREQTSRTRQPYCRRCAWLGQSQPGLDLNETDKIAKK